MENILCKSGVSNLIENELDPVLETKIGSIMITLIQKASMLGIKYSKSSGRTNLSSTDIMYALQYLAHEFEDSQDLEDDLQNNEDVYNKLVDDLDGSEDSQYEDDDDEDSDDEDSQDENDDDEYFVRSDDPDPIIQKINEYHDGWLEWVPDNLIQITMKKSVDKVLNSLTNDM